MGKAKWVRNGAPFRLTCPRKDKNYQHVLIRSITVYHSELVEVAFQLFQNTVDQCAMPINVDQCVVKFQAFKIILTKYCSILYNTKFSRDLNFAKI